METMDPPAMDDSYSMPDDNIKNPLFMADLNISSKDLLKNDLKMRVMVVIITIQVVTMLLVGVGVILGLVLITMSSNATTGTVCNCSTPVDYSSTLDNVIGSLASLQTTTTSTAGVTNDILLITEDILDLTNRSYLLNYINAISCQDILRLHPNISSGYYHINSRTVYCNMDQLCGSGGGWTRIAYIDMSDATQNCPDGYELYKSGSVRACGRPNINVGGCGASLKFPTNGISYTQICGRVTGYQYGSPEASDGENNPINNINSHYVDGVSITRGSPREHVWTLMGGFSDSYSNGGNCPCNDPPGGRQQVSSFVDSNYFCESGNPNENVRASLYTDDPLWDGQGCGSMEGPCCNATGLPWFYRQFNTTSTDYIELRVCGNYIPSNENTPFSYYEIYIK